MVTIYQVRKIFLGAKQNSSTI